MAGRWRRWSLVLVAVIGCGNACDCASTATVPGAKECTTTADCGFNEVCRDGLCVVGLPVGEGEGEPVGEGEGEPAEGEGEGEGIVSLVIAPSPLQLAETDPGVAVEGTAQIVNVGDETVTFGAVTSSDPRFAVLVPATGAALAPTASQALTVRFTPTTAGAASTTVTVNVSSPAGIAPARLTVSGSARQPVVVDSFVARAGPDDTGVGLQDCVCRAQHSPAAVRVSYTAVDSNRTCARPAGPTQACGIDDTCSPCSLGAQGSARWRSGRTIDQGRTNETWVVDDEIVHEGEGADGDFIINVSLADDCVALLGSTQSASNSGCCLVDCENAFFECYDYPGTGCATDCQFVVNQATSDDECMARGPVLVRARLTTDAGAREFCGTMTANQTVELARAQRRAGAFALTSTSPHFTEVALDAPCP